MPSVSVRYIVNDVDEAIAFYCAHLGFNLQRRPETRPSSDDVSPYCSSLSSTPAACTSPAPTTRPTGAWVTQQARNLFYGTR